jgi:hypothetical protein
MRDRKLEHAVFCIPYLGLSVKINKVITENKFRLGLPGIDLYELDVILSIEQAVRSKINSHASKTTI